MTATTGHDRRVAVVGATGAVGGQLFELLCERGFPFSELRLFASPDSAAQPVEYGGHRYPIEPLTDPGNLKGFDLAFLAVPPSAAGDIVRARPGPLLIDLSAAGRAPAGVPFAAPGLTSRQRMVGLSGQAILAPPHPAAEAIASIMNALGIEPPFVGASLMLGASSMGKAQVSDLIRQSADLLNARLNVGEDEPQLAFNIYLAQNEDEFASAISAQVGELLGHTPKLMLRIVRAPVLHGTALTIFIPATAGLEGWRDKLVGAPGLLLLEDQDHAGVADAVSQEAICLSVRSSPSGLALWCVFDNARRTAMSALWIAECVLPAASPTIN